MKDPTTLEAAARESAVAVGLRYVHDSEPGFRRKRQGSGFVYLKNDGSKVSDAETLRRIRSLVVPPAWENVWICAREYGHLQATGRDARGRKQYRYHPRFRATRDETKFARMLSFAGALPKIRQRVEKDFHRPGMSRAKVLAGVVKLLEITLIRVGNDEYARTNHSYGLTTLRNRHARVQGAKVTFSFRGKSGVKHEIDVRDPALARLVRRCQDLPGQELFAYTDPDGTVHDIGSQDVNAYLHEITGENYTAKDFRTWAGSVLAAIALREFTGFENQKEAKSHIVRAVEAVAKMLGNTPSVCRKCYVHPHILESYLDGATLKTIDDQAKRTLGGFMKKLRPDEAAVVMLLQQRLATGAHTSGVKEKVKNLLEPALRRLPKETLVLPRQQRKRRRSGS